MASQIRYANDQISYRLRSKRAIARWIEKVVAVEGFSCGPITFIFCSQQKHLEINRQYLGHDWNTDVITFDYSDHKSGIVSGDIFIDPVTVRGNARVYGTGCREEMLRVIVHGVLHLCGYGDKSESEQNLMRSRENHHIAIFRNEVK